MKKILLTLGVIFLLGLDGISAENVSDANINHSPDYYRQQIIVQQKYSERNFLNAVAQGNLKLAELYLKSGMSPDTTDLKVPAVFIAMEAKQYEMLDLLLKNGADKESTALGVTPLMFAINRKDAESALLFIENNANINKGYKGLSPLYYAISKKQYDIAEALVKAGAYADDDTIIRAVQSDNENIKNMVLKRAVQELENKE